MIQTIGIYGGSFNPIHLGHLEKLIRLNQLCHFDKLFFLPCGEHSLKKNSTIPTHHRLEMIKIALTNSPFEIDTQEILRPGKSYTIDSLRNYRKQYGQKISLSFIMGHDAFSDFMQWKEFDSILSLAHIILLSRPTHDNEFNPNLSHYFNAHQSSDVNILHQINSGHIIDIQDTDYPYSSSDIREAIQHQQKPLGLDPKVYAYIKKNQLYC